VRREIFRAPDFGCGGRPLRAGTDWLHDVHRSAMPAGASQATKEASSYRRAAAITCARESALGVAQVRPHIYANPLLGRIARAKAAVPMTRSPEVFS